MKKVIRLTESDLIRLVKRVIKEQSQPATNPGETQISGPFSKKGQESVKYFVYQKGGKFYIYMSTPQQLTPKLSNGAIYNNKGAGYNTEREANQKINGLIALSGPSNIAPAYE